MSEPERYLLDRSAVIDPPSPAQITSGAEYRRRGPHVRPARCPLLIVSVAAHHRLLLLTHNAVDFTDLSPRLIMIGLDDK